MRSIRSRIRVLALVLVTGAVTVGVWGTGARAGFAPPDFNALTGTKPYVRMFTEAGNCSENRQTNQLTGSALTSKLADLTSWFVHFHAEGSNNFLLGADCQGTSSTTLASKLSALGAWVSNYRNGSYVSQSSSSMPTDFGEAADIETNAPLAIATFWPGNSSTTGKSVNTSTAATLTGALTSSATTLTVNSASAYAPAGAPGYWPYTPSRGSGTTAGAHSADTHDFVSWVRVDNELMQIMGTPTVSGSTVTLTVKRGLWGTAAAAHNSGTKVMSPVYVGSTSAVASDANLNGAPSRDDANYPLRYGIKIWQNDGEDWIAGRIKATFGPNLSGYNTAWLDVSSCSNYNNADYTGQPIVPWDDPDATKMDQTHWGAYQKTKLAGLRQDLPGVHFTANNLGGDNISACTNDLLANYDGGVLEHWMKNDAHWHLDWAKNMGQLFSIQQNNWPAIMWVRWNYDFSGNVDAYKRFSYGSLLLGLNPNANKYQYGGPFGLNKPDPLYFWNWGTPLTSPTGITDEAVGNGLYRRDFSNGIVVVNPGTAAVTYSLGTTYYDVNNLDANGNPSPVTSVTIQPNDASFLLKAVTPNDTTKPTVTLSSPAAGSTVQSPVNVPVAVTGSATDNQSVAAVNVDVTAPNGTTTTSPATLTAPSGSSSSWSYSFTPTTVGSWGVKVEALDASGNVSASSTATVTTYQPDATSPTVSIEAPANDSSMPPTSALAISGAAADNVAVASVNVTVQGTTGAAQSVPVTLSNPDATSTTWKGTWTPPGSGTFTITARSVDTSGNAAPGATSAVTLTAPKDGGPPTIVVVSPANAATVTNPVTFSGTASDDVGVSAVNLAIRDASTGLWLQADGKTWKSTYASVPVTVATLNGRSTNWSWSWKAPKNGSYGIAAVAWDAAGHFTTDWQSFKVGNSPA